MSTKQKSRQSDEACSLFWRAFWYTTARSCKQIKIKLLLHTCCTVLFTGLSLPENIALGSSSYLRFLCKNILTHSVHKKLHNINTMWQHYIFIHVKSSEKWVNVKGCLVLQTFKSVTLNPLNPELNPICYLLALLRAHHFLHVSGIRVKLLTLRWLMSYIYGAPILDVSRSHTTTQHSR